LGSKKKEPQNRGDFMKGVLEKTEKMGDRVDKIK